MEREPFLGKSAADVGQSLLTIAITIAILVAIVVAVAWVGTALDYEPTWDWWSGAYLIVGIVSGALAGLAAFAGGWLWSVQTGKFWGFAIGWAPSSLLGFIVFLAMMFLWLPAAAIAWWWFQRT